MCASLHALLLDYCNLVNVCSPKDLVVKLVLHKDETVRHHLASGSKMSWDGPGLGGRARLRPSLCDQSLQLLRLHLAASTHSQVKPDDHEV